VITPVWISVGRHSWGTLHGLRLRGTNNLTGWVPNPTLIGFAVFITVALLTLAALSVVGIIAIPRDRAK
jgi:hypothetical protein